MRKKSPIEVLCELAQGQEKVLRYLYYDSEMKSIVGCSRKLILWISCDLGDRNFAFREVKDKEGVLVRIIASDDCLKTLQEEQEDSSTKKIVEHLKITSKNCFDFFRIRDLFFRKDKIVYVNYRKWIEKTKKSKSVFTVDEKFRSQKTCRFKEYETDEETMKFLLDFFNQDFVIRETENHFFSVSQPKKSAIFLLKSKKK